jgi:glycosyltransferase involved in cell wall biosynthesis
VERAKRRSVQLRDSVALGEARKVFATSRNVADRLQRSTGIDAEVMPHPPQELPYRTESYDDFVLSVGRLDRAKRHELLLDALAADPTLHCVIVGDGPDRERLERVAEGHGLNGRVEFRGRVDAAELAELYARCGAVYYAPIDEDFGMVPYEAFLAEKPVVTTTDAGGPLEIVADRETGLVIEPQAAALAEACSWLRDHVDDAKSWGQAGKEIARRVSWDETIARLLQ